MRSLTFSEFYTAAYADEGFADGPRHLRERF